jgi:hypothetical protein
MPSVIWHRIHATKESSSRNEPKLPIRFHSQGDCIAKGRGAFPIFHIRSSITDIGSIRSLTGRCTDGFFKGECVLNLHTPPPAGHLFSGAENVGMGVSGTYAGDQAELTGTALVGKEALRFT